MVYSCGIEKIIGVGVEIFLCVLKFDIEKYFFFDIKVFLVLDVIKKFRNEIILIKGFCNFGFDFVLEELELKVYEIILEVNLGVMVVNLNYYCLMFKLEIKMVCMVKVFVYGVGLYEIVKIF